ncbi:MAG TPA: FAD-dependent oxidoreductase [Solirubrobacteraceae bacterium]|jgi:sulfide:quinone oxidoreductase|nr:FAD-dependent oxidoreductase [Solirubrobacteraceae bacterium]
MSETQRSSDPAEVVIVGGGVAALEALMALRAHAGDGLGITLIAPQPEFVYRPMMVAEPFDLGSVRRYPLQQVGSDFGARVLHGAVTGVDTAEARVVLRSGGTVPYDTLILAPGARMLRAFDDAIAFGEPDSGAAMRELLVDLDEGRAQRVAFVAPTAAGWLLPLYELALLTARHVANRALEAELVLITPEPRPLALFGPGPSAVIARLLDASGVEFIGSTLGDVTAGGVRLVPGDRVVPVDRAVALPLVRGPKLDGVPAEGEYGFIPVDKHGRVAGLQHVYAAGDATDFPVKQGGLAAQQADAVAEHVAARHGARLSPAPFTPVLRGMLFTGDQPRYLSAAEGEGPPSSRPLWWPPTKIAGRHLAPYLLERDEAEAKAIERAPEGFDEVEIGLEGVALE